MRAADSPLTARIGPGHGTALYVSALLGAGVLVLPGQLASAAGPACLLSWAFAGVMGVPLAALFAALARRYPDAGGVATYVTHAFGDTAGGVTGWLYLVAGSVGQTIVPLTGGYYVAEASGLGRGAAYVVAAGILALAVAGNLAGMRVGSRAQIALAAGVAVALAVVVVVAAPHASASHLTPFAPHGLAPVGAGVVVLFYAFAGWEAVGHLAGEFRDPQRDVPRAVAATIVVVTVLYLGVAAAVVGTGTYGDARTDHVALGLLLGHVVGGGAGVVAAVVAVVISLGTTNAYVAGVSRLAHSLGRTGWLPRPVAAVRRDVPVGGVLTVAAVAYAGLGAAALVHWGTETLVVVPATLVVTVYLLAAAAGVRLLRGPARGCAAVTIALTAVVVPSAAPHVVVPAVVVALALVVRALCRCSGRRVESSPEGLHPTGTPRPSRYR